MTQHILHIENEGRTTKGAYYSTVYKKRPYCECGWLGEQAVYESYSGGPDSAQQSRNQFYEHLMGLFVNRVHREEQDAPN